MNGAVLPSSSCTQITLCVVFHIEFISDPYLDRYSNYIRVNRVLIVFTPPRSAFFSLDIRVDISQMKVPQHCITSPLSIPLESWNFAVLLFWNAITKCSVAKNMHSQLSKRSQDLDLHCECGFYYSDCLWQLFCQSNEQRILTAGRLLKYLTAAYGAHHK